MNYPDVQPLLHQLTITYRECKVSTTLTASVIGDQKISVDPLEPPIFIYFDFNQGDCSFKQTLTALFFPKESAISYPLPSFI